MDTLKHHEEGANCFKLLNISGTSTGRENLDIENLLDRLLLQPVGINRKWPKALLFEKPNFYTAVNAAIILSSFFFFFFKVKGHVLGILFLRKIFKHV